MSRIIASPTTDLPVLLPFKLSRERQPGFFAGLKPWHAALVAVAVAAYAGAALAQQAAPAQLSAFGVIVKWVPLLVWGFAFNILISVLSMAIGTISGTVLGLALVGPNRLLRWPAWMLAQFFRNAPWLVLLFFAMFLIPFQVRIGGVLVPLPDWVKATIGFALPVMANVAEIVRGAVRSVPSTQWEAAEALSFTPRQTMWMIILPQCVKRMLPPWMNIYSLVTMATVQASIVGVTEMLTLTGQVHAAEGGRPELFAPLYGFALLCFFVFCYPIDLWTARLERRFQLR